MPSPSSPTKLVRLILFLCFLNLVLAWGPGRNGYDWSQSSSYGTGRPDRVGGPVPDTNADTYEEDEDDDHSDWGLTHVDSPPTTSSSSSPIRTSTTTSTRRETTALDVVTDTQVDIHTVIVAVSSSSISPSQSAVSSVVSRAPNSSATISASTAAQSSAAFRAAANAHQENTSQSESQGTTSDPGPDATISLTDGIPKLHDFRKQVQFGTVAKMGSAPRLIPSPPSILAFLSLVLALRLSRAIH